MHLDMSMHSFEPVDRILAVSSLVVLKHPRDVLDQKCASSQY